MTKSGAAPELVLGIVSEVDVTIVQLRVEEEAARVGLSEADRSRVKTSASELATNILKFAGRGTMTIRRIERGHRRGIEIVAEDRGPGIPDVDAALRDHFSTSRTLGLGLPGVRRLMDEFEIVSAPGRGTCVKVRKWST